ncbi:hypothetical protein E8E13_002247 [Curvularia kusanoi]|uniref:Cytochrome b561 domain-containing protein n=1 Tax=Curvularia kusanoi TaxID=90978 RepID=A0A9P4T574_CURKU|nr:hypothetical protein E8E13_002247 [Curvularia kusanoi]
MSYKLPAVSLALAVTKVSAQYGPGGRYGPGGSNNNGNGDGNDFGNFGGFGGQGGPSQSFINSRQQVLIAHGVLASLAFVILFPVGSILIRLGSFRGAWLIHGLFQVFTYLVYTAAVGIGIWLAQQAPAQVGLFDRYHPIIGLVLFAMLFFQPIMGYVHHLKFKRYKRRTIWSYEHLWVGRIAITLGMINGGLGLLLAYDAPLGFAPSQGQGKEPGRDSASKKILSELGFTGSAKEQKREQLDYETAEKLCGVTITPSHAGATSKTVKCDFSLLIPSYLPATVALPSVEVSYAVFATCNLPNGKIVQASQDLHIIREAAKPLHLEPSRTVSFPETTFAVRASFDTPKSGAKNTSIPTTLQLNGLKLPINDSMRTTETRWLVPREIKWELEETAVLITGVPDATGHIPMSSAHRALKKRTLATGKEKLKLRFPFTRPGNTPITLLPETNGMQVALPISAPATTALGDTTALAVAGGHILHTIQQSPSPHTQGPCQRFAVYLEYKLHLWLRIGEDVFDEASGDLVNRKMDEMAYTVVCPLAPTQNDSPRAQDTEDGEPAPLIPPSYDGVWELPPPEYSSGG